mgnify:FL=1
MIYILIENEEYDKEIRYVFDYIFKYIFRIEEQVKISAYQKDLNLSNIKLLITYGKTRLKSNSSVPHLHIYESDLFSDNYLNQKSMPSLPLEEYEDEELKTIINETNLPVIYTGNRNLNKLVTTIENIIETNIDIIASSFFMLSRYEEVVTPVKDKHNRFPAEASVAYKEDFLNRPIVNEYIELLWYWMKNLQPKLARTNIWNDKDFAFFLSHDIDHIYKYGCGLQKFLNGIKKIGGAVIKRQSVKEAFLNIQELNGSDPYFIFEDMMKLEDKYDIKSSWYFKVDNNTPNNGDKYLLNDLDLVINKLINNGHEIGIHPSYNSYDNSQIMKREAKKICNRYNLRRKELGVRQHYLRFDITKTWSIQEECGLLYDSTLGYADVIGFRAGVCHPYKPYDLYKRRVYDLWEIPLIVMDGTLKHYMNLTPEDSYKEIMELLKTIQNYQGVFSLLWHNSSLDSIWKNWDELYFNILKELSKQDSFSGNGINLIKRFSGN